FLSNIAVNDGNTESAPSYAVFALSTGYTWLAGPWEVSAFARVDNLFDKDYAGSVIVNEGNGRYYEPAPGRNWTAGVQARFIF
ncbi:MAG: TonB-dependent siderophore receptor, partial [Alcaligenaceae bacterium]|nr:TonB-dependent siderophore receptor [Alcaligenaceae bacterium]